VHYLDLGAFDWCQAAYLYVDHAVALGFELFEKLEQQFAAIAA
jgi:hypothetical protein